MQFRQFSLRSAMVVVLLVAVGIGWYMNWRRANIGVELAVPTPLDLSCEVPGVLREYSSGAKVREHDRNHQWPFERRRIEQLKKDLSSYRRQFVHSDEDLLRTNRDEMVQLAGRVLGDEDSSFKAAANAAWILTETGDPDAYSIILNRVKKFDAKDDEKRWELFDVFPAERLVTDSEFLKIMKDNVGEDSGFSRRCEHALFKSGVDRQPRIRRMMDEANQDPTSRHSIDWLLRHAPSTEALELAEAYLFEPPAGSRSYSEYYLIRTILITDFSDSPELKEISDRIERKFADLIRELRKQDGPDGGHIGRQLWNFMVNHGTVVSKDLLLETFGNPELESLRFGIVRALIRIGHGDECRTFMENAVAKSPPYKGVFHLDLHEQCCGREASIEVCTKLAKEHSSVCLLYTSPSPRDS